jgi:hypothetical protein
MMCPHGGTVQASPTSTNVQIGGTPALTASDVFVIAGCPFLIALVPSPCVSVQWVQPAAQSTAANNPTLTEASVGLCVAATQAPQGPVMIVEAQPNVAGM